MAFTLYDGTQSLTDALLAPTSGITVIGGSTVLSASGQSAVNLYDGSLSQLGIGAGLLLTSGTTPGTSNTVGWFGTDNSTGPATFFNGDADIDAVVNTVFTTQSYDATTLEFDFTADPSATSVSFDVVFGTDEYPEWVDQFVDCAVVMVNGVNYALFNHDPLHPLSVISSNLAAGYFQDNAGNVLPIEYDGVSHVLKIIAPIKPNGAVNHIKIGIADTGDHIYDSGIFIANLTAGNIPGSGVVITDPSACTDGADNVSGSVKDEYFDLKAGDDTCYAGAGDDIIVAGAGADIVYGGSGADQMEGDGGDDVLDGGADVDTAVFGNASTAYGIAYDSASNSFTVNGSSLGDGIDTLKSVELAKFSDGLFALTPGGLTPVTDPGTPPANTPGALLISGIGSVGSTLTATVSDPDGISGPIAYQWQSSTDGTTFTNIGGATANTYVVQDGDKYIQALAAYVDGGTKAEMPVSVVKSILGSVNGDLVVKLMQLTAPAGASVIDPLTTLVQNAMDLGLTPNMAALAVKTVLGLPAAVSLQSYDAYAALMANPLDATGLAVEKVAVQVAILASLSDDESGMNLTLKIVDAAANAQTLDLANVDDLSSILGIPAVLDPGTQKYPEPLNEIYDRNKTMADALHEGGNVTAIENEWQDLLSVQDKIASTSIADLSIHVNQPPVGAAVAQLASGLQDVPYVVNAADLLAGFADPEGGALSVVGLSADVAQVLDNNDGTFTITPLTGYFGPVELTYAVMDVLGASSPASQLIVIDATPAPVDHEATGTLSLAGSAIEGGLLQAAFTGLADADGPIVDTTYQWQQLVSGAWNDIAGAQAASFDIPADQSFVGHEVRVVATTADTLGGTTSFTSTGQTIANVDDAATGTLAVTGTPEQGGKLAAGISDLADADGPVASIKYQWQENVANVWTDLAGANTETLAIPADASLVGKQVHVIATTTDALGGTTSFTSAAQTITALAGVSLTGSAAADTLTGGAGNDTLSGLGGVDTLSGLGGNDTLLGGAGNDTVRGGAGDDLLDGGAGSDALYGDEGIDTASWTGSAKAVNVSLVTGKGSGGDAQGDLLYGIENLTGSAFNDTLVGDANANVLDGASGADILRGLGGPDVLRGGAGADKFDFDAVGESAVGNADLILDFELGIDKIDLSTIDANSLANKNQAFSGVLLQGLGQAFTAAGQLRYEYSSALDMTTLQGNVNSDVAPEFEIQLVGNVALSADAFIL